MRPVHQTKFVVQDEGGEFMARGNCLQAALASVFDLDLDEVPHFVGMAEDVWWTEMWRWLRERNIQLHYERVRGEDGAVYSGGWFPLGTPYLLTGPSPRGDFSHVVVAQDHEIIHDPHPDGSGLADGWRGAYFFIVADPAAQRITSHIAPPSTPIEALGLDGNRAPAKPNQ